MPVHADLVIPANDPESLKEICSWDGFRPATFASSDFPVDVVRFAGSVSPPVVLSRSRRADSLKALPATLRARAQAAFDRAARRPARLAMAHGRSLDLTRGSIVMGVVNVTPDSFSDGGVTFDRDTAVARSLEMFEQGADIVDVGGESTRPPMYGSARELTADEEIGRVVPVIAGIRARSDAPMSVDTRRSAVAREAVAAGADLVNDVSAGRYDPEMRETIARTGAGAILMHMKGTDPRTMQQDLRYEHLIGDVAGALAEAAEGAVAAGIRADAVAVDPGLGFGKTAEANLALLKYLEAFRTLGFPVAVGASRKAFVRRFSGVAEDADAAARLAGSLAALAAAADGGAAILRVHDVLDSVRFLRMRQAIAGAVAPAARRIGTAAR